MVSLGERMREHAVGEQTTCPHHAYPQSYKVREIKTDPMTLQSVSSFALVLYLGRL